MELKNGVQKFMHLQSHLRVDFTWKNQLKCIGTAVITLALVESWTFSSGI